MMRELFTEYVSFLIRTTRNGWNRFWFRPEFPETLALIRIATGLMLLYTHLVWSLDLEGFLGMHGRIPLEFVDRFHNNSYFAWTWFRYLDRPLWLWSVHLAACCVFAMLAIGWRTRLAAILSFLFASAYAHRAAGALFGLDQINVMLSMYLLLGDSGGAFSWDAWRRRWEDSTTVPAPTTGTNVALRLIQIHMCVIYFFAAIGKLQGVSWWDGQAMWLALANYEYQTVDLTFLGDYPWVINFLTHATVLWELSYCVLVWPRVTRPLVLAMAIPVHLGIALCMGMMTFGLIMLVGNLAFVPADLIRRVTQQAVSAERTA